MIELKLENTKELELLYLLDRGGEDETAQTNQRIK